MRCARLIGFPYMPSSDLRRSEVIMRFPTTSWTMVSAAGSRSSGSAEALNALCAAYWFPVYAFIRRRGYSREAAEDLSQEFFARILEHDTLSGARRERGKFRSFLLASLTNFLANEWDRSQAQKRGGGAAAVQLRFDVDQSRLLRDDVRQRLLALAGNRAPQEGVLIITSRAHRTQEANRAEARARLDWPPAY